MSDQYNRRPLSPTEFRQRVNRLLELYPHARITSTWRSEEKNLAVGGQPGSKHTFSPLEPIAVDVVDDDMENIIYKDAVADARIEFTHQAKTLGLYAIYHDVGSGPHLHLQAHPPGQPSDEYLAMLNPVGGEGA